MRNTSIFLLFFFVWGCSQPLTSPTVYLGQGMMVGEVTTHSVLLQARISRSDTFIDHDLPGAYGLGIFQLTTDSTFTRVLTSDTLYALPKNDFLLKTKMEGLQAGRIYYYRLQYGGDEAMRQLSPISQFKTLAGPSSSEEISFVAVTGMNYYHFHFGKYDRTKAYKGADKALGYPALEAIEDLQPDYFIGTGDNVYFDHPDSSNFSKALAAGKNPHPGNYNGAAVTDESGMRQKYHQQFGQARFKALFQKVGTYWEKDDHDYRFNDADTTQQFSISHALGVKSFREQLPVVDPKDSGATTYRTHRMNADLQIWLLEGRDYRSPNAMPDGPDKTLLGQTQLDWLKMSLLKSDAAFKLIISPTPLVGPDDAYKRDNHVNRRGFRYEGEALFAWLTENGFLRKGLYLICGDRHWQYHAIHPSGFEEFSTGALVDNNARAGRLAGDPKSTDPDGLIQQPYIQGKSESASGGFLLVRVHREAQTPKLSFQFYDEQGLLLYETTKVHPPKTD